ncbi:MAG: sigma-70 family RNA polymerase sigma factor [Myxococcota bacterium]
MPDVELYDAWASGDREAGNELCNRYFDPLYRFFANKVGPSAEDLVQETLAACFEAHARWERRAKFRTFMYAIARNILRKSIYRSNRMDVDPDFSVRSIAELCPSPSSVAARSEATERLDAALRQLPVDYQIALELYYWEELSGPDLAEVLELSIPAMRSRLRRAKQALEEALEGQVAWPTSGRADP